MIRAGDVDWSITHQHDSHKQLRDICHDHPTGLATIIFLAFPSVVFNKLPYKLRDEMSTLRNLDGMKSDLIHELLTIREEMFHVTHRPCFCSEEKDQTCNPHSNHGCGTNNTHSCGTTNSNNNNDNNNNNNNNRN
ncbi:hypothetical protein PPL_04429 [Heterostelium album PN500]|uniref:Uncharacterized protein n=1 Tax=Heterostelium pallidum (strain ATCC 26659 / Pp 5 / PN500) TaxID=670386 RepID=D3B7J1_HETP5|nr:hypothetical protein PPL_04429 [Heterostelium album PN500]EFA82734.1 hypothetical protein PPL_04429 [Heterostelium album PN500]|eukprot:XP_020434851.1 hypothetical protein PPL_04429 [Heterostelium album PN500]